MAPLCNGSWAPVEQMPMPMPMPMPMTMIDDESPGTFDREGHRLELVLYKSDACPYCTRVLRVVDELGLELAYRDTRRDPGARAELVEVGGKSQVPCLVINGRPLYESADIVRFLREEVRAG